MKNPLFRRPLVGCCCPDLGHVPQEEDPARTVAAVKAFLGMKP